MDMEAWGKDVFSGDRRDGRRERSRARGFNSGNRDHRRHPEHGGGNRRNGKLRSDRDFYGRCSPGTIRVTSSPVRASSVNRKQLQTSNRHFSRPHLHGHLWNGNVAQAEDEASNSSSVLLMLSSIAAFSRA